MSSTSEIIWFILSSAIILFVVFTTYGAYLGRRQVFRILDKMEPGLSWKVRQWESDNDPGEKPWENSGFNKFYH